MRAFTRILPQGFPKEFHLGAFEALPGAVPLFCFRPSTEGPLVDFLLQGFPDEFHLGTLEALLGAVPQLQPGVRLAGIMASLMDRLARFVANGDPSVRAQLDEADAFGRLKAAAGKVPASQ